MYFQDHSPPHFHAEYQGVSAEYNIQTLETIVGKLPRRAHALVLEWASLHKEELLRNWDNATQPKAMQNIEPLD